MSEIIWFPGFLPSFLGPFLDDFGKLLQFLLLVLLLFFVEVKILFVELVSHIFVCLLDFLGPVFHVIAAAV